MFLGGVSKELDGIYESIPGWFRFGDLLCGDRFECHGGVWVRSYSYLDGSSSVASLPVVGVYDVARFVCSNWMGEFGSRDDYGSRNLPGVSVGRSMVGDLHSVSLSGDFGEIIGTGSCEYFACLDLLVRSGIYFYNLARPGLADLNLGMFGEIGTLEDGMSIVTYADRVLRYLDFFDDVGRAFFGSYHGGAYSVPVRAGVLHLLEGDFSVYIRGFHSDEGGDLNSCSATPYSGDRLFTLGGSVTVSSRYVDGFYCGIKDPSGFGVYSRERFVID